MPRHRGITSPYNLQPAVSIYLHCAVLYCAGLLIISKIIKHCSIKNVSDHFVPPQKNPLNERVVNWQQCNSNHYIHLGTIFTYLHPYRALAPRTTLFPPPRYVFAHVFISRDQRASTNLYNSYLFPHLATLHPRADAPAPHRRSGQQHNITTSQHHNIRHHPVCPPKFLPDLPSIQVTTLRATCPLNTYLSKSFLSVDLPLIISEFALGSISLLFHHRRVLQSSFSLSCMHCSPSAIIRPINLSNALPTTRTYIMYMCIMTHIADSIAPWHMCIMYLNFLPVIMTHHHIM